MLVGLPDKIQDTPLNLHFISTTSNFLVKFGPCNI